MLQSRQNIQTNPIIEENQDITCAERSPKAISVPLSNDVNASALAQKPLTLPPVPTDNVIGQYLPWDINDFDNDSDHWIISNETANLEKDKSRISNYLDNLLDNNPQYSSYFWDFITKWKEETGQDINQLNLGQYIDCYSPNGSGTIAIMESGEHIPVRMVCNETICLLCESRKRRRLAYQKVEELKPLFQTGKLPGIAFCVATLPEEIEDRDDIIKDLVDNAQNMFRELYGLDKRSNIYIRCAVHPVGHSDFYRTRFHLHLSIIPVEISMDGIINQVEFPHNHEKANTNILRKLWGKCLKPYINIDMPVFKYEWIDYEETDYFYSKLGHRYIYDYRSFAHDIEISVLRINKQTGETILKCKRDWLHFWRKVDIADLVDRYKYIRKQNKIYQKGWGMRLKKIIKSLNLDDQEKSCDRVITTIHADVTIIRKKEWSKVLKRIVRNDIELWTYLDPISGKVVQKDKREIIKENIAIREKQKKKNDILEKNMLDFLTNVT
jgi:hypothetical protein